MLARTKRKQWKLTERKQGKLRYFEQLEHSNKIEHCEIKSYKSFNGNKIAKTSFR